MKKRKGWSAVKKETLSATKPPVAAAASVPSSFTSTKALWETCDKKSPLLLDIPVTDKRRDIPGLQATAVGIHLTKSRYQYSKQKSRFYHRECASMKEYYR